MIEVILNKLEKNETITEEEIITLLEIDVTSKVYYTLLSAANDFSRKHFNHKGKVFGQVGIETRKCSGNCKFCSLAKDRFHSEVAKEQTQETILASVAQFVDAGADEVFLMTMADYPIKRYLDLAKQVKTTLPSRVRLIGNIGDFNQEDAMLLREAGFSGMYHICRLREGVDTDIPVDTRLQTLDAIKASGLELYYCVEPIGPEHTYKEIAQEILRATQYPVTVMAAMRRVCVPGTPLAPNGEITSAELAKIVAVALLVVKIGRASCRERVYVLV